MSKAMVNYLVDGVITAAFVATTFTGIVFLLPFSWIGILASGEPGMLGVSMATWNTVHEWSALAMIAGVVVHLVLHWRWIVHTTRCVVGRRARRNRTLADYVLDMIMGAAFLVATFSGIVFLLPSSWIGILASGEPGMLGVSMATWNAVHEWSSVLMIGGAVLHVVLHWSWVVGMSKRAFGSRRPVGGTSPDVARAAGVRVVAPVATDAQVVAAGATDTACDPGRGGGERRISRKTFLAGTVAACAGAAFVLVLGRGGGESDTVYAAADTGSGVPDDGGNGSGWGRGDETGSWHETEESEELPRTDDEAAPDAAMDGSGEAEATEPAPDTLSQRVSIDAGVCNGCSDCVSACSYGVFAFSGGVARVAAPDACVLCGRCVRVCPTGAVTLRT